jgi:hypothetical protein
MRFGVQAVSHLAESQVVAVPEVLAEFVTRARAFVPIGEIPLGPDVPLGIEGFHGVRL